MAEKLEQAPWNVIERDPTDRKYLLVHNCLTGKTFRLQKRLAGTPLGDNVNEEWRRFLKAEKLIVNKKSVLPLLKEKLDYIMDGLPGNKAEAVFIPTYDCQLDCVYCYNEKLRTTQKKKALPADKIAKKFIKHYKKSPAQFWSMTVSGGGEPLLAVDYIYEVANLIIDEAEKQGRDFEMKMVTNGAALTRKKAEMLYEVGLERMQTTIDPDHAKSRPFIKGKDSYETILKNLMALPKEIGLSLGSNVRTGEQEKFRALLKKLEPLKGRLVDTSVVVIMDKLSGEPPKNGNAKMSRANDDLQAQTLLDCIKIIDEAGFPRKTVFPRITCETFMASESYFLNFAGEETFCPGLESLPEYRTDKMSEAKARSLFDMRVDNPQWRSFCFDKGTPCEYLTKCWGGCRLISVTEGNGWGVINCEKPYLDKLTRHQLRDWAEA